GADARGQAAAERPDPEEHPGPHRPESAQETPADRTPDAPPPLTPGGLPRRVRQASLAPQLKKDSDRPAGEGRAEDVADDRDADAVRARMASLQRGWQRGRRDAEDTSDAPPRDDDDAGSTAPGTTTGGDG